MRDKKFSIKDRKAGINFPPFHSWCRCSFTIAVDDWDKWIDDYAEKHGKEPGNSVKSVANLGESGIINTGENIKVNIQLFASKEKQCGKKVGKHAIDFGLAPSKTEDREVFQKIINNIQTSPDRIAEGNWRGQEDDVLFYIKGEDVVVTKQNNEFITVLKGGVNNARVKNARNKKV